MSKHNIITLLIALTMLLGSNQLLTAQKPIETYQAAIDQINCAVAKKMLISFERSSLAKNIANCKYETMVQEVKKTQENQTKGYKQDILNIIAKINEQKNAIENPSEYVVFETALDELSVYAEEAYSNLCGKYKKPTNNVCRDFETNNRQLQQEISNIVNKALVQIGKTTYGGEKANERKPATPPSSPTGIATPAETESNTPLPAETTKPSTPKANQTNPDNNLAALISTIVLVLLIAAVGWLYKEQQELKEQVEDLRMMLRVYNRKDTTGK